MGNPDFQFAIYHGGQQVNIKAVKIRNSYLIYRDGKAQAALHKNAETWEELLFEPLPRDLFTIITTKLDRLS